jgi:hypothetical protein
LGNRIDMDKEKIIDIVKNHKNTSNKELIECMDFLSQDFEKTKDLLVKLTYHLDNTEKNYNKLLEEYQKRISNA